MGSLLRLTVLACLAAATVSTRATAFCRTNTCEEDRDNPNCHEEGGCLTGGQSLFWAKSCISFSVHAAASPARGISYDEASAAIAGAMFVWTDAVCGGEPVSMEAIQYPAVACDLVEYNQNRTEGPNANVWMFRDGPWPYDDGGNTLALTAVWFNVRTGEIYDADVEVNSKEHPLAGLSNATLAEIATHEAGHIYGLAHSNASGAIMYETYSIEGISQVLTRDDEAGMCAMYPPDPEAPSCDPTPRNGFGPQCGGEPPSCRAVPGGRPQGQAAPWLILGALLGLGRVRVRRRSLVTPA